MVTNYMRFITLFTLTVFGFASAHNTCYCEERMKRVTFKTHVGPLPDSVDWVDKGAVTSVKNQGQCGSCWTFSATGAIESAYYLKYGKLLDFSEQELVSCDSGSMGCKGGLMDQAFDWVETRKGLCSESDFPYVSGSGTAPKCKQCKPIPGSQVDHYVDVPVDDENALMSAVAQQPIAVAIEADQIAFQMYKSGILTGKCGSKLDHGVLVVGYGTDKESGIDYWKVKNSWGSEWGESGYIRLQRGKVTPWNHSGECGILAQASFPVLV
jgi:C1A family cysteine protease